MPTRARAAPLVGEMSVFATASLHGRRVVYAPHGSDAAVAPPTQAQLEEYVKLTGQNTTTFSASEKRHPINVFEQVNVCVHCGCERFTWVLPESAQTKDTGTLAEYLTSLGVEVSEIDLDEEEDDDDDSDLDDDDLIDAEAEEAGEEEEEE